MPVTTMARTGRVREARSLVRLAAPLVVGQLSGMGMQVVDTVLAGRLGAGVLGAVAVGSSVYSLALVAVIGVMMALPPSVAQLHGEGRPLQVAALFRQALWLALGLGAVGQQAVWWGGPALVAAAGIAPELARGAAGFLRAISLGVPGLALLLACRGLSDGLGMVLPGMVAGLLGLGALAPLGYLLMNGVPGVAGLGAVGSGLATAAVLWMEALGLWAYLRASSLRALARGQERGGPGQGRRGPDAALLAGLLRLGGPIAVSLLLEVGLFTAAGLVVGGFGASVVAGHQIALNVAGVAFMVPLGVAMAITIRVGAAVGRGDARGAREAGLVGIGLTVLTQSVSCAVIASFPGALVALYTRDVAVAASAASLLRFAAVFQLSDGIQAASGGALRGLKDTRMPMAISALSYWVVGVPIGLLLAFPGGLGAPGMWVGIIAGLSCAALCLFARFWRHSGPAQGMGRGKEWSVGA